MSMTLQRGYMHGSEMKKWKIQHFNITQSWLPPLNLLYSKYELKPYRGSCFSLFNERCEAREEANSRGFYFHFLFGGQKCTEGVSIKELSSVFSGYVCNVEKQLAKTHDSKSGTATENTLQCLYTICKTRNFPVRLKIANGRKIRWFNIQ